MSTVTTSAPFHVGPFVPDKMLGQGSFASVWHAHHATVDLQAAIKVIPKGTSDLELSRTLLVREVSLMREIKHPFIIPLFLFSEDESNYYLLLELVDHSNLRDHVNASGSLREDEARRYFSQIVWVLEYLHCEKHIAHRDLKCENILLDRHNNIRLIDFGFSRLCDDESAMLTACGSPAYAAPEVIQRHPYNHSADIWSLGVVLYAMTVGRLPYDSGDVATLLRMIVCDPIVYPHQLSPPLQDLLQRLLCKNPDQRIGLDGIKSHPWFSLNEFNAMVEATKAEAGALFSARPVSPGVLDPEIVAKMAEMGFETPKLCHSVLQRADNEIMLVYDILRREALTEKMGEIMASIARQEARLLVPPDRAPPEALFGPSGRTVRFRRQSHPSETLAPGVLQARTKIRRLSKPLAGPRVTFLRPVRDSQ
jgi:tRNA A-37 threonylcarbamoyl transferase component Bud32